MKVQVFPNSILSVYFYINIYISKMGALTSKPYAFTARPWELRSVKSVDIFDALGSSIRLDMRGLNVMRVLPSIQENLNEEWISDKIRFSYDAFKRQRLSSPLIKVSDLQFKKADWVTIFYSFYKRSFFKGNYGWDFVLSRFADLHSSLSIKWFSDNFLNNANFVYPETASKSLSNQPFRNLFSLNGSLNQLEESDVLFISGLNLRLEAPLLNIRVRRAVLNNNLSVYYFGQQSGLNYKFINLGFSALTWSLIIKGKHPLCTVLSKSKKPLVWMGSNFYSSFQFPIPLYDILYKIFYSYLHNVDKNWVVFHYVPRYISSFLTTDLFPSNQVEKSKNSILFISDEDSFNHQNYQTVVYQGSHGDRSALVADFVLPSFFAYEKDSIWINLQGKAQFSGRALTSPLLTRSVSDFFFAFARFSLKLSSLWALKSAVKINTPLVTSGLDKFYFGTSFNPLSLSTLNSSDSLTNIFFHTRSIRSIIRVLPFSVSSSDNYYLTDHITRNSAVMALSFNRFKSFQNNFF
jgi:NADH dehydrogenase (ubiquinone) Fe-S protein 1